MGPCKGARGEGGGCSVVCRPVGGERAWRARAPARGGCGGGARGVGDGSEAAVHARLVAAAEGEVAVGAGRAGLVGRGLRGDAVPGDAGAVIDGAGGGGAGVLVGRTRLARRVGAARGEEGVRAVFAGPGPLWGPCVRGGAAAPRAALAVDRGGGARERDLERRARLRDDGALGAEGVGGAEDARSGRVVLEVGGARRAVLAGGAERAGGGAVVGDEERLAAGAADAALEGGRAGGVEGRRLPKLPKK